MRAPLVVIGLSARMLAASAARAGIRPIAIDLFADRDTREIADCISLPSFEYRNVLPAIEKAVQENGVLSLVYGSGIDSRPDLIEQISNMAEVIGNSSATLRIAHSPNAFFSLLDTLAIPYPQTLFRRPANPADWLFKVPYTEGGRGVFPGTAHPEDPDGYYQKKINRRAMSVLFLANREDARIVGFNTQWTVGPKTAAPYRFAGIANYADLNAGQKELLADYATKLVKSISLVGINSLDFILEDGQCKVLELNPRPVASAMLYDDRYPCGFLAEHVRAFEGLLPMAPVSSGSPYRGLEVVYAQRSCEIGANVDWPDWGIDRPMAGTRISVNDPLCTVTAEAASITNFRSLLLRRKRRILDVLYPLEKHLV